MLPWASYLPFKMSKSCNIIFTFCTVLQGKNYIIHDFEGFFRIFGVFHISFFDTFFHFMLQVTPIRTGCSSVFSCMLICWALLKGLTQLSYGSRIIKEKPERELSRMHPYMRQTDFILPESALILFSGTTHLLSFLFSKTHQTSRRQGGTPSLLNPKV